MAGEKYLLDTNTVSYIIKGQFTSVRERLAAVPIADVCISAITEAELMAGLARLPQATRLRSLVLEFLLRVEVLPFDRHCASTYGALRGEINQRGLSLGAMDMLIAAHAKSVGATLVSSDRAFSKLADFLRVTDWSK